MALSLVFSAQTISSAMGMLTGILLVRLLPPVEYAFYTIALSIIGSMSVLSDAGVSAGALAEGGKVWQNAAGLGGVINAALGIRRLLGAIAMVVGAIWLVFLLYSHDARWWVAGLAVIFVSTQFYYNLQCGLLDIPLRLNQVLRITQFFAVKQQLFRLIGVLIVLLIWPNWLGVLAIGIPVSLWSYLALRRYSSGYVDWSAVPDAEVKSAILCLFKRALPGAIYFCLSGQLYIWLLSIFGSTLAVASYGALSRVAIVIGIIGAIGPAMLIPRFSRVSPENLCKTYYSSLSLIFLLCLPILVTVYFFSASILDILGPGYKGLDHELFLSTTVATVSLLGGTAYGLVYARGWLLHPAFGITVAIGVQVAGILIFNVKSLNGVLGLGLLAGFQQLFFNTLYFHYKHKWAV